MQAYLDAFHSIEGQRLSKVLWRSGQDEPEAIWLVFEKGTLLIQVNEEDDTISVNAGATLKADECVDLSSSDLWQGFVGQPFGWSWVATNQQGYRDVVLLGFDGITPQVMLEVMASSIKIHRIGAAEPIGSHKGA
ncbi:hypothetical protein Terro_3100 [Terriglobus roseus DSM 18391]|uniref:Uncharacterized protein n=1 Tax=Terriglobus roseus (strain DSM 18391 / NRRL B-41598 / KBS 63) TaxID=926566 RepID=I3ZD17_TERRK|nr:DUF6334 family protein [Terriglobus roseus]AFL87135.1 hypothetical protein Terro_0803 [Terriglobus roseus DSM 18391]AFL89330.1 hypothetical protein Terro_3100 [Terriglobus roseus DSM 18391]